MMIETGQRVTVVGLGREGRAVTRALAADGACVTVSDRREERALTDEIAALAGLPVRFSLGGHRPEEVLDCDLLVLSPGVDKRTPLVREAVRRGIPITSETALFLARCPAPVIGVTGSAGKTTTTTLIGAMLRRDGARPVFVGGNIGAPLLERLDEITPDAWVVLELSSFQLEWLEASPSVAVVTNITPNHLDRHETMAAYTAAKANIVAHQRPGDVAVLNRDDAGASSLAGRGCGRVLYFSLAGPVEEGAGLDGDDLTVIRNGRRVVLCRTEDLHVPGRHNVANALAAAAAADACGARSEAIRAALTEFRGVPHRLQQVGVRGGIVFYDDSIATAPERTLAALAAISAPVVLILGGHDKCLPWTELARAAVQRCRGVVLIGEAAGLIRRHLEQALADASHATEEPGDAWSGPPDGSPGGPPGLLRQEAIVEEQSMAAAVARAASLARPGDAVVLAPGCASYDMYRNFEERGDDFARAVGGLDTRD